ncbi:hypothetical protein SODALDRAFT_376889, partial [Sodiomyces alkalinus F11]
MKFILPITLLAGAAAVSAQSSAPQCDALYIVETCLEGQNQIFNACAHDDWDCKCHGAEAIATCYNNCPSDPRANAARGQVTIHCQNASIHGTAARHAATATAAPTEASESADAATAATPTPTAASNNNNNNNNNAEEGDDSEASASRASASASASAAADEDPDSGVARLARNTGGLLLAVAGV